MIDPIRSDVAALTPSGITLISRGRGDRPGLIPLWYGESDLPTPDFIRAAAKRALDDGMTFYTPARGVLRLREAIRDWHRRRVNADIDIERITVPGSAMLAVMHSVQCLVRTGDEVIVIAPMWPNIFQAIEVAGGVPRFVWLKREQNGPWRLDMDEVIDAMNAAHEGGVPRVAVESDRLGDVVGGAASLARCVPRTRHRHHRRRSVRPDHVRRLVARAEFRDARRTGRRGVHREQFLESLGDDRLAGGLVGSPAPPRRSARRGVGVEQHRRDELRASRRNRRDRTGRSVRRFAARTLPAQPRAARRIRRRPSTTELGRTARRFLRLCRDRRRHRQPRVCRFAVPQREHRRLSGHVVRSAAITPTTNATSASASRTIPTSSQRRWIVSARCCDAVSPVFSPPIASPLGTPGVCTFFTSFITACALARSSGVE